MPRGGKTITKAGATGISLLNFRSTSEPHDRLPFKNKNVSVPETPVSTAKFDSSDVIAPLVPISRITRNSDLSIDMPQAILDPNGFPARQRQEVVLLSSPIFIGASTDMVTGALRGFQWNESQVGRSLLPTDPVEEARLGQNISETVQPLADWTALHWFFRFSDCPDMKGGTDWEGVDQGLPINDNLTMLDPMNPLFIADNWITSNQTYLPVRSQTSLTAFTVDNEGGVLIIEPQGVDSIGHYVHTRFNPRRRVSFNPNPSEDDVIGLVEQDTDDRTHRYINFTLESSVPGIQVEVLLMSRFFANTNGRAPLDLRRVVTVDKADEPLEFFIDISDTFLYDRNPADTDLTIYDEPPVLAYFALKAIDPRPCTLKLYRVRALNGIFSHAAGATNFAKGVEQYDFTKQVSVPTITIGAEQTLVQFGGRFVQFMGVLSTTNPPFVPRVVTGIDIDFAVGQYPTADDLIGTNKTWELPPEGDDVEAAPKFPILDGCVKDFVSAT